jgi:hypothetical protein
MKDQFIDELREFVASLAKEESTVIIDRVEEKLNKRCNNCHKTLSCDRCPGQQFLVKCIETL